MGWQGRGATLHKEAQAYVERTDIPKARWEIDLARAPDNRKMTPAERVIDFLEDLPITKGILAGKSMRLLEGQKRFIEQIYSVGPRGKRIKNLGIKSEPKGNGKTGLIAGLALAHLLGPEAEERGEVYSAAIDRGQAAILFEEMKAIVERVPQYACRVNIIRNQKIMQVMWGHGNGSKYEALSSDGRRAHGLAPSLWVYDELAQTKTRELLDNLMQGMSKRDDALGIVISTQAPSDDHALSQLIDDALLDADNPDSPTYVQLDAAGDDEDPWDPEVWKRVNPAWGIFLNAEDFTRQAERAKRTPAFEPAFRNLRLNQRVNPVEEARLVSSSDWKRGAVPVDPEALAGRECFAGLDLSGKVDLTTLQLVFPDGSDPRKFDILSFFWTPVDQLAKRRNAERERFNLWIRQGYIEPIPGPVIRYDYVARRLGELALKYKIRAIAYDRWRIEDLQLALADLRIEGLPLEPFGQGHSRVMAPAIDAFNECALEGRLRHGGNPVLTASVVNAIVINDTSGNPKIDKSNSNRSGPVRVDGAVALVMALGTAYRAPPERAFTCMMI